MDAFDTKIVNSRNRSLCPFFIWKKNSTLPASPLKVSNRMTQKNWRGKALLSVEFCAQGIHYEHENPSYSLKWSYTISLACSNRLLHSRFCPHARTNLILLLQVRACVSNVFRALLKLLPWIYFHTASENETQRLAHGPSTCSPGCSLLSPLNHRRWRSVLEVGVILFSQISCLVKFWLEWKWSSSGLDSNKTLISVVGPQLHTCLRERQEGK